MSDTRACPSEVEKTPASAAGKEPRLRPKRGTRVVRAANVSRRARESKSDRPTAATPAALPPETGRALLAELRESGFIGMWKDRTDIGDSSAFARRLREGIETRADRDDRVEDAS